MKKSIGLSLVAATLLAGNAMAMDLAGGKLTGDARALYMSYDDGSDTYTGLGIGLNPTYSMDLGSGLSFEVGAGVAVPVTESDDAVAGNLALGKLNDAGDKSEMYAVLNKYNITYGFGDAFVKVGAQNLDTPMAGSDDIRLVPNTFTAAVLGYTGVKNVTLIAADVMSMAGIVDGAADDSETYQSMSTQALGSAVDDKDVQAVAAVYGNEEAGANAQLWYYMMGDAGYTVGAEDLGAVSAMYLDAGMAFGSVNVAAQYISFATGLWSNTSTGVKVDAAFGDFGVTVSTNSYSFTDDGLEAAAGAAIIATPAYYAWGGYPEYAVADEKWAGDADWDGGSSTKVGLSYGGVENLDLSAAYVTFSDVAAVTDVVVGYTVNEQISAGLVYETVAYEDDYKTANTVEDETIMKVSASYAF